MQRISLVSTTKTSFGKTSEHKETTRENGEFPFGLPAVCENGKPTNVGGRITNITVRVLATETTFQPLL